MFENAQLFWTPIISFLDNIHISFGPATNIFRMLTPLMKVGLSFTAKFHSKISPPLEPTARVLG